MPFGCNVEFRENEMSCTHQGKQLLNFTLGTTIYLCRTISCTLVEYQALLLINYYYNYKYIRYIGLGNMP